MNKLIALTLGLGLVASAAQAQTWTLSGTQESSAANATIVSSSTLKSVAIGKNTNKVWVFMKGGSIASATVLLQDNSGNTLDSIAVAVPTTYTSVTFNAPQFASRIKVSPTTLAGGNVSISTFILQQRGM